MQTETATATLNPTDASASARATEASATLLAAASNGTGGTQQTQTTETPAVTPETPAAAATTTETTPAAAVPEKYEFKAPEGTEYDSEILETFTGAAKAASLTQDAAQKVLETMAPALAARQADQVQAIHKEWQDASAADKEFGGSPEKLAENLGVARKGLEAFSTPELRKLLDETGLGNHPEVIRYMYRAGKAISEDKFVGGAAKGTGAANPAAVLYDNTKKG